ncbi:MAG: 16S rRNA (guanine(966)-N(2))-methyltransferase RsmD [Deltaproteobacteria bacterium]|nr:16S rRNA (guanine(966)-N(2))-methyltransferase RsmD [Deltaproteobacteria bacterium]
MRIIAGTYRGRRLRTTSGPGYRPATGRVRESVFSMLESLGVSWPDTLVADIFAGSGALAIEALSRGARGAVFVEKAAAAAALIRANLEDLGVDRGRWQLIKGDALRWLGATAVGRYGLVFIDPPYGRDLLLPSVRLLVENGGLAPDGLICAEVEAGLDLPDPPLPVLEPIRNKLYGQTRICIWGLRKSA